MTCRRKQPILSPMDRALSCPVCADVIGVYESVVENRGVMSRRRERRRRVPKPGISPTDRSRRKAAALHEVEPGARRERSWLHVSASSSALPAKNVFASVTPLRAEQARRRSDPARRSVSPMTNGAEHAPRVEQAGGVGLVDVCEYRCLG